jgi:type IV secretory pathway VirB6-like protein
MGALRDAAAWPLVQVRGWAGNVREVVGSLKWQDFLPPALLSTAAWVWEQFKLALGFGTVEEQLSASFALGIVAVLSTILTLGLTIAAVVVFVILFGIGMLRLWPVFDNLWPLGA